MADISVLKGPGTFIAARVQMLYPRTQNVYECISPHVVQAASAAEPVPIFNEGPTRPVLEAVIEDSSNSTAGEDVQGDMLKPSAANTPWVSTVVL